MSRVFVTEETLRFVRPGDVVCVKLVVSPSVGGRLMGRTVNGDRVALSSEDIHFVEETVIKPRDLVDYNDHRYWGKVRAVDEHFVWIDRHGDEKQRDSVKRISVSRRFADRVGDVEATAVEVDEHGDDLPFGA